MLRYGAISKVQALQSGRVRTAIQDAGAVRWGKLRLASRVPLWHDERAVVALEYCIIAGIMVFIVFTVSSPFATALSNMFTNVANQL